MPVHSRYRSPENEPHHRSGFTLIEILVALVIFAVLSVLGYQGLTAVVNYSERTRTDYEEHNQLHRATVILMQDLLHLRARTVRDRLGGRLRAYDTSDQDYEITFTRGALPSIVGSSLGGMQRVGYSVSEENQLLRWVWPTLDAFGQNQPDARVLLDSVKRVEFFQLNARNEFEQNWPPLNETLAPDELPRMIRMEIEMENGMRLTRLLPGAQTVPGGSSPDIPGETDPDNEQDQ